MIEIKEFMENYMQFFIKSSFDLKIANTQKNEDYQYRK